MSCTRLREYFKGKLELLRFPAEHYGLHGLREQGVTAVTNNEVADRLFKKQGHWRSESV